MQRNAALLSVAYAPRFLRSALRAPVEMTKGGGIRSTPTPVISSAVEKSNHMVWSTEGGLPLAKGAAEHSEAEGFAPTDMRQEF